MWLARNEGDLLDRGGRWARSEPPIGEELVELTCRRGRDACEHVAEVGEGLDLVALAGGDEAEESCGGVPAVVGAAEEPVLAADGHAAQGVLGCIVVDGQVTVGGVHAESIPLIQ